MRGAERRVGEDARVPTRTVSVVLPAYNEALALPPLFARLASALEPFAAHVIVVDDGSDDDTVEAARTHAGPLNLALESHGTNLGLGRALDTGLKRALQLSADDDVIVTMDADNTHDPTLIGPMLEAIAEGHDVVIASRYHSGGGELGLATHRRLLSRCASLCLAFWAPVDGARDYTCGYRAYRAGALRQAYAAHGGRLVEESGFTCMAEVLLKLSRLGASVTEVPLVLRYDLKPGRSKMKVMRTIGRYFWLAARIREAARRPPTDPLRGSKQP